MTLFSFYNQSFPEWNHAVFNLLRESFPPAPAQCPVISSHMNQGFTPLSCCVADRGVGAAQSGEPFAHRRAFGLFPILPV